MRRCPCNRLHLGRACCRRTRFPRHSQALPVQRARRYRWSSPALPVRHSPRVLLNRKRHIRAALAIDVQIARPCQRCSRRPEKRVCPHRAISDLPAIARIGCAIRTAQFAVTVENVVYAVIEIPADAPPYRQCEPCPARSTRTSHTDGGGLLAGTSMNTLPARHVSPKSSDHA